MEVKLVGTPVWKRAYILKFCYNIFMKKFQTVKNSNYRCTKCSARWVQTSYKFYDSDGKLMGYSAVASNCPSCGSLYMKWENSDGRVTVNI